MSDTLNTNMLSTQREIKMGQEIHHNVGSTARLHSVTNHFRRSVPTHIDNYTYMYLETNKSVLAMKDLGMQQKSFSTCKKLSHQKYALFDTSTCSNLHLLGIN